LNVTFKQTNIQPDVGGANALIKWVMRILKGTSKANKAYNRATRHGTNTPSFGFEASSVTWWVSAGINIVILFIIIGSTKDKKPIEES
jgi:hypothetical protein